MIIRFPVVRASSGSEPPGDPTLSSLGEIRLFAGSYVPAGWMRCDGRMLAPHLYPDLFAFVGTAHGGDGLRCFALPNFSGRRPRGLCPHAHTGPRHAQEGLHYIICVSAPEATAQAAPSEGMCGLQSAPSGASHPRQGPGT